MKEKKSKREWVKTVAIIFLSVLLVLTFFSNTIKNYSLPEVSAQYVYEGSVTNKVRGSGTVVAKDPYVVNSNESRKIESVAVNVGDEVQKGDVIYYLADGDSEELSAAKKELEDLYSAYESAIIEGSVTADVTKDVEANGAGDLATNQAKIAAAKARVESLEKKLEKLNKEKDQYTDDHNHTGEKLNLENAEAELDKAKAQNETDSANLSAADAELSTAKSAVDAKKAAIKEQEEAIEKKKRFSDVSGTDTYGPSLEEMQYDLKVLKKELDGLKKTQKKAQEKYDACLANYNSSAASVANWTAAIKNANKGIDDKTYSYTKQIADTQEALNDAKEAYEKILAEVSTKYGLEGKLRDIEEKKKEVAKLEESTVDGKIVAPISGKMIAINYTAGQTINVKESNEVATIQQAGDEYTLEMSVTMAQARLINVGDEADVSNSWYYSDVHARVKSIRPDPSNPSSNKIVVFEVDGEGLSNGQTLNLTVGNRTGNYDIVVPSSAIREDNDGNYVLRVISKSTPLGNRYIAEKVQVTVLAEDDANTAISGNLDNWGEYIITTASKPIEDGQQVRLKD